MKKLLLLCITLLLTTTAQEFNTGNVYIKVTNAGATLFGSPNRQNLQIVRISPLISGAFGEVFDYLKDADSVEAASTEPSPQFGQYHVKSLFDNSYSFAPPAYEVELNVYGWTLGAYAISHYNITNIDSFAYDSKFGFEVLPIIDNHYGYEKIEYDYEGEYIRIFKDSLSTFVGMKFLNTDLNSLYVVEWDTAYNRSDSLLYASLFVDSITDFYESEELGSVLFPSITPHFTNPGEGYDVYIAIAVGDSKAQLDSNISIAVSRYNSMTTSVDKDEQLPNQVVLMQNYPNPFNPSTNIKFTIPNVGNESFSSLRLVVYDVLGREIETLVNGTKMPGTYEVIFDASNLASGIYYYQLTAGNFVQTKKMMVVK